MSSRVPKKSNATVSAEETKVPPPKQKSRSPKEAARPSTSSAVINSAPVEARGRSKIPERSRSNNRKKESADKKKKASPRPKASVSPVHQKKRDGSTSAVRNKSSAKESMATVSEVLPKTKKVSPPKAAVKKSVEPVKQQKNIPRGKSAPSDEEMKSEETHQKAPPKTTPTKPAKKPAQPSKQSS